MSGSRRKIRRWVEGENLGRLDGEFFGGRWLGDAR